MVERIAREIYYEIDKEFIDKCGNPFPTFDIWKFLESANGKGTIIQIITSMLESSLDHTWLLELACYGLVHLSTLGFKATAGVDDEK